MKIAPFAVEQWMNAHENNCEFNLAETCVESLTVAQLLELTGRRDSLLQELLPIKLTYGAIAGTDRLRSAVAALYESRRPECVLITHGAAGANALVYQALVDAGDRVITLAPTYQQHHSIPESLGADVQVLQLAEADDYQPDLEQLAKLASRPTKLIALTNPNNPTGALLPEATLRAIAQIAERAGAYILSDEVYRGTTQVGDTMTPSLADMYAKAISVGSMSKAYSLAGLRLGWIFGPTEVLQAAELHRDYNTISVGMLDDLMAAIALESADVILARSRGIVRGNLATLDHWMRTQPRLSYRKPQAGTITLLRYAFDMPSHEFCLRLLKETGVLFTPGSAFGMEGTVRIGYANGHAVLAAGLPRVAEFLESLSKEKRCAVA
jgi:aspartate/methionine/tyrosine aminotransferase